VEQNLTESCMKPVVEPAGFPQCNGQGPMDHCVAEVVFSRQSWKVKCPMDTLPAAIIRSGSNLHAIQFSC
jgi:hypothetical protein